MQRLSTELGLCWTETLEPRSARGEPEPAELPAAVRSIDGGFDCIPKLSLFEGLAISSHFFIFFFSSSFSSLS